MKKIITALLIAAMVFSFAAFGEQTAGMANPNLYGVEKSEMTERTGMYFNAPEGAENVSFNVIGYESEVPMAEMTFDYDGNEYTLRAVPTMITSIYESAGIEAGEEGSINISGIMADWTALATAKIVYCDGIHLYTQGAEIMAWLDVVPGILYNLSVNANIGADSAALFLMLAEECFIPDDELAVTMVNPNLYDVTTDEQTMRTGLSLKAPEGAENIMYNVLAYDAELPMAELTFTFEGKDYCLRAEPCAMTSLYGAEGEEVLEKADALELLPMEEINISGIYTDWSSVAGGKVSYCNALCLESSDTSLVIWMDVVPGVLYNISAEKTDSAELFAIAEAAFTPMQGDC